MRQMLNNAEKIASNIKKCEKAKNMFFRHMKETQTYNFKSVTVKKNV
jgi:hypothetical protein